MRGLRRAAAVLAVALTAAGCATTVSGHGSASLAPATSASSSADFPTAPATSAPVPAPSSTSSAPLASQDITDVHWRIPPGFVKSHAFHPVTPLERHYSSGYVVPSNERSGLDVISITLYRTPSYVPVDTIRAQEVRVRYYNDLADARPQNGLHVETLHGWPAIQENAIEQHTYRYAAWFVFSRRHLLEVSCQVDQQVSKVIRGCRYVLRSLEFS